MIEVVKIEIFKHDLEYQNTPVVRAQVNKGQT